MRLRHSASADASGFGAVTSRLQHRGYTVIAPANPLRGPANEVDNVKALVYLNALALDEGESNLDITKRFPNTFVDALLPRPFPQPDGTQGTDLYVDPARFRALFAPDLPARTAAQMASAQRPLSLAAAQEKETAPAWKTIPSAVTHLILRAARTAG